MYWHCYSIYNAKSATLSIVDIDTFAVSYSHTGYIGHHAVIALDQTVFLVPASNAYYQSAYDTLTGHWRRLKSMEGSVAAISLGIKQTEIATRVTDEFWQSVGDGNLRC